MKKNYLRFCLGVMNTAFLVVFMMFTSSSLQAQSNCCIEGGNGGVGCDDAACEALICAGDAFCCDTSWDGICAGEAIDNCAICMEDEGPGTGDCCDPGGNGTPGCEDAACEALICGLDSFCCDTSWDGICAGEAIDNCAICMGDPEPTCDDGIMNGSETGVDCGGPDCAPCVADSDCCTPGGNGTSGCDDAGCQATVCALDSFCCDVTWDGACAALALLECDVCTGGGDDNNDDCSGALPISCGEMVMGTTVGATLDPEAVALGLCDPDGPFNNDVEAPGVWYTFTAEGTGTVTLSTCNAADFDTKLSLYEGGCGTLSCVSGNDDGDGCDNFTSILEANIVGGVTYHVLVHGFGSAVGMFKLMMTCEFGGTYDDCAGALPLACGDVVDGSTIGATLDPEAVALGLCDPDGPFNNDVEAPGVWYEFTPDVTGTATFSTCNTADYDTKLSLYGGVCGELFCVSGNDDGDGCEGFTSILEADVTAGETYYLLVHGFGSATGDFTLSVDCGGCDDSANAPEINCPGNITVCGAQNITWVVPTATDADGCVEPTVSVDPDVAPGDFFGVGTTTVTYTAEDSEGLTDDCSFDITVNPLPEVGISPTGVPEWCQGVAVLISKVFNEADLAQPIMYEWSTGEDTPDILVSANGTYGLTVTDGNGCSSSTSVLVDEDLSELLSAHTILVEDALDMESSTVLSGGVGVLDADEINIQDGSDITTFLRSALANIDGSSNVNDYIDSDSPVELPDFISNPFNDNNNQMIVGTVTLTGSNYGDVFVKSGSTLNIGNGEMYMRSLTVQKGSTVNFDQEGILVIRQDMSIGAMCNINVEGPGVVVYVGDNVQIGQGCVVAVDIYAPEGLDVSDSGAFMTTYMYGLFITDELTSGDNVVWGWNLVCGDFGGGDDEPQEPSDCCFVDGNGTPGCDDEVCEAQICAADAFCCDTEWDGICAAAAIEECVVCGGEEPPVFDSNCCDEEGHGGLGCDDAACEALICAQDSFCCDTAWDGICASAALEQCTVCGGGFDPFLQGEVGNETESTGNSISADRAAELTVFPNPTSGVVNIRVADYIGSTVDVQITNAVGQKVWFQHIEVLEVGRISVDLSADRYPAGMYQMTLFVNDAVLTKQIVLSK